MNSSYQLISPPATEPITLDEAKLHCRIEYDFTDDDDLIRSLIKAAREYTEETSGGLLLHQTWKLTLDRFPAGDKPIIIRKRPVTEIDSIDYVDDNGATQSLASYQKDTDGFLTRIRPAYNESWPSVRCQMNAVEVRFTAGYEDMAGGIPQHLKQAMLLLVGHYYEHREDSIVGISMQTVSHAYDRLVGINRVMNV